MTRTNKEIVGIKKRPWNRWPKDKEEEFKRLYPKETNKDLAMYFGVSKASIEAKAAFLNLKKGTSYKRSGRSNKRPLGSQFVGSNGYIRIKIKDTGVPNVDWVLAHRHVWESHYGPIHKGHQILLKDGNRLNINIENLECISNVEHCHRNSIQRFPKTLHSAIRLLSKLDKKLKDAR